MPVAEGLGLRQQFQNSPRRAGSALPAPPDGVASRRSARHRPARLLLLGPLLTLAAVAPALQSGRWQVTSAPTGATLDGRPLGDLPYTPPAPQSLCLTATDAADPAAWLARDAAKGCALTTRTLAGGRVELSGTCPPSAKGLTRGTVRITGRWTPTSYDLRFVTTNPSENGVMGFSGAMTGRRIGACG